MGRHSSSDSDEDHRRSKRKKRRRSRSRSISSVDSYSSKRSSKKSKKSKKKHRKKSRSRSRSSEYRRKRSRSRSRGRRSRSRGRRSRSRSRGRRSRTRSRGRRSRSRSRGRRSRSRSRGQRARSRGRRSRSSSFSKYRGRRSRSRTRRSTSRSRRRSRSQSRSKIVKSRSSSVSKESRLINKLEKDDPCANIPGFQDMSSAQQNEIRMKLALKAAAETDARLREQGVLLPSKKDDIEMSYDDDTKRQKAIQEIEGESFAPQAFLSNRSQPKQKEESADDIHEAAMFGDSTVLPLSIPKAIVYSSTDSLMAPIFYEDPAIKWERWAQYVKDYRNKKLEGDAMS